MRKATTTRLKNVFLFNSYFKVSLGFADSASKHALQAFCDSLRAEVHEDNIEVSVVSPAYIKTNLSINAVTGDGRKHGGTVLASTMQKDSSALQRI